MASDLVHKQAYESLGSRRACTGINREEVDGER